MSITGLAECEDGKLSDRSLLISGKRTTGERWRRKEAFIWLAPSLSVVSTIEGRDLRLSDSLDLSLFSLTSY